MCVTFCSGGCLLLGASFPMMPSSWKAGIVPKTPDSAGLLSQGQLCEFVFVLQFHTPQGGDNKQYLHHWL